MIERMMGKSGRFIGIYRVVHAVSIDMYGHMWHYFCYKPDRIRNIKKALRIIERRNNCL